MRTTWVMNRGSVFRLSIVVTSHYLMGNANRTHRVRDVSGGYWFDPGVRPGAPGHSCAPFVAKSLPSKVSRTSIRFLS